ncbi:MAG: DUF1592 domain-containing protein, partial [Planctomycetales bacterium]|nr:DUF1592 domain-containing protein [Planctomycetales bacterium]
AAAAAADPSAAAPQPVRDSFSRYCASCHGERKQEARLRIDPLADQHWADYELLDAMLARLDDREMPPDDAQPQLPDAERASMIAALKGRLAALESTRLAGSLNRLTRSEWCDTLEDLTGLPVERPYELPIDSSHAMGRLGEHQLLTTLALRQYQEVIERYVDEAILETLPKEQTLVVDFTKAENQIGNTGSESQPWGILSHNDQTSLTILSPVQSFAAEGEYEFTFDYCFVDSAELKTLPKQQKPTPITVDRNKHFGRFRKGGEVLGKAYTHNLDGEKLHPSGRELFYRFDEPLRVRLSKDDKTVVFAVHGGGKGPRWVFDHVTIRGPLGKDYPPSHERIFAGAPRDGDLAACRAVLDRLGARLFRRPVDAQIMAPYYDIAARQFDAGGNLFSATKACLKGMLCSPHFFFKQLGDQPELDDYAIAARLSYFLANSAPDEKLHELAATGALTNPAVRRAEAVRLLADSAKSERFVRLFATQWLRLDRFGDFAPNVAYINENTLTPLRPSIDEEPVAFFQELLRNNLPARNFIHSDFVVWDRRLFDYYNNGKKTGHSRRNPDGAGFHRYDLSKLPDEERMKYGGLVTMPIVMCMTTDGETTQPILRGAWVVQRLFGHELTPPDSVPALEIDLSNVDKPQEILRLHKQKESCYACHAKMDYMGLALENYDVMGRWQSNYLFPVLEGNKPTIVTKNAVDSLAETPDGKPVAGVAGLKAHLLAREDEIMRNLIEKLFGYAIGRAPRYGDRPAIDKLQQSARANEYRLGDMILDLVASESFARR